MVEVEQASQFNISADDETIAAALEQASIPTLMMSMIHMSGDCALLDGPVRPAGLYINEYQGYMSEEDKAEVRRQALDVIRKFRDAGCKMPPPPSPDTVRRMMSFLVAAEVPEDYVPMMLEEMELDGHDWRSDDWGESISAEQKSQHPVLVIGGGMSGILAAVRLKEAGLPFVVIEKNASVGGTWYENRYPGARVDVGNHLYCYSFEPAHHWTEYFSRQPELQQYFEQVVSRRGLQEHFRLNTEVVSARYDSETHTWLVETRDAEGRRELHRAGSVISAVGQLNRPRLPDIPGLDDFRGQWCHSAAWDPALDYRGQRVAVVGAGASAFQLVPAIAGDVAEMTVFQRTPPWMFDNPIYHERVPEGKKWCLEHLPYYGRWFRFLLFWPACDGAYDTVLVDPDWPQPDRAVNEANDFVRQMFSDHIRSQVGDNEALLDKVLPDYPPLGRRTLQDNGSWLAALQRDNVSLLKIGVDAITETGLVDADGREHQFDVIIFATGFQTDRFLWPMEIAGRGGASLAERWATEPAAYLGITVPEFPNFYCLFGPGTNLAFGGSLVFNGECQVRHVMACLRTQLAGGHAEIECRRETFEHYQTRFRAQHAQMIWEQPSIARSYYRNREGKVTLLWPWKILDMWRWTRDCDPADYRFS